MLEFAVLRKYRKLLLVGVFLACLVLIIHALGLRSSFSLSYLRTVLAMNQVKGIFLFVLLFSVGNLIQVPGWIFLAASVLVLGRLNGAIVTYTAAIVSCAITFISVRWVGQNAIENLQGKWSEKLIGTLNRNPIRNTIYLRLVFQTLAALNYTLALTSIKFKDYILGTILGLPIPIALYCIFFDYIERMFGL
jgi:uncharacterized membrane protein YdjX (TVP38/TMEM64 family)